MLIKKNRFLLILAEIVLSQRDNLNYPVLEPKFHLFLPFLLVFFFFLGNSLVEKKKKEKENKKLSLGEVSG